MTQASPQPKKTYLVASWATWGSAGWLEASGTTEAPSLFTHRFCAAFYGRPSDQVARAQLDQMEHDLRSWDGKHVVADYAILDDEQWAAVAAGMDAETNTSVLAGLATFDDRTTARDALKTMAGSVEQYRPQVDAETAALIR